MLNILDLLIVTGNSWEASLIAKTDSEMRIQLRNWECVSKGEVSGGK